jgi:hypothetical protein
MLHLRGLGTSEEVGPVALAVFGLGVEVGLGVEALGSLRVLLVARPLYTRTAPELLVS